MNEFEGQILLEIKKLQDTYNPNDFDWLYTFLIYLNNALENTDLNENILLSLKILLNQIIADFTAKEDNISENLKTMSSLFAFNLIQKYSN